MPGATTSRANRYAQASAIEHHEGAIAMAETEQADGDYPAAVDLAESIIEAQSAEIDKMEEMLGS